MNIKKRILSPIALLTILICSGWNTAIVEGPKVEPKVNIYLVIGWIVFIVLVITIIVLLIKNKKKK